MTICFLTYHNPHNVSAIISKNGPILSNMIINFIISSLKLLAFNILNAGNCIQIKNIQGIQIIAKAKNEINN